uniref:Uncharacterized protein n=1 Tax=Leersia perrieri TaxID=77586 RepID=A0A0D9W476_9ORYZ
MLALSISRSARASSVLRLDALLRLLARCRSSTTTETIEGVVHGALEFAPNWQGRRRCKVQCLQAQYGRSIGFPHTTALPIDAIAIAKKSDRCTAIASNPS